MSDQDIARFFLFHLLRRAIELKNVPPLPVTPPPPPLPVEVCIAGNDTRLPDAMVPPRDRAELVRAALLRLGTYKAHEMTVEFHSTFRADVHEPKSVHVHFMPKDIPAYEVKKMLRRIHLCPTTLSIGGRNSRLFLRFATQEDAERAIDVLSKSVLFPHPGRENMVATWATRRGVLWDAPLWLDEIERIRRVPLCIT